MIEINGQQYTIDPREQTIKTSANTEEARVATEEAISQAIAASRGAGLPAGHWYLEHYVVGRLVEAGFPASTDLTAGETSPGLICH